MKAYTDLSQSKKLAKILPLESADMVYIASATDDDGETLYTAEYKSEIIIHESDDYINCWSLAALLGIIHRPSLLHLFNGWRCDDYNEERTSYQLGAISDNPVDACVDMVAWLIENKYINIKKERV